MSNFSMQSARTVEIPRFNFCDRIPEQAFIAEFLSQDEGGPQMLLVEGVGGIGKSRLIERILTTHEENIVFGKLNFSKSYSSEGGLLDSLKNECRRLRKLLSQYNRMQSSRMNFDALKQSARKLAPAAGSAIPIVGSLTKSTLQLALEDKDPIGTEYSNWTFQFIQICRLLSKYQKMAVVIDDQQNLDSDEKHYLIHFLGQLIESSESQVKAIVASRPSENIRDEFDAAIRDVYERAAHFGILTTLRIKPLNSKYLQEITDNVFSNPGESNALIELSHGSPQRLLELVISMNIHGDLSCNEDGIQLPADINEMTYLTENIWNQIGEDKLLYEIASTLSVGMGSIQVNDISKLADVLRVDTTDILSASAILQEMGVFRLTESSNGDPASLEFSHDTLKDQIYSRITSGSSIASVYFNELSSRLIESILKSNHKVPDNISLFDVVEKCIESDIELVKSLARNIYGSKSNNWETFLIHVGAICLNRNQPGSAIELVDPAIKSLEQIYEERNEHIHTGKSLLVQAYYRKGMYRHVLNTTVNINELDSDTLYSYVLSETIEKNEGWFEKAQSAISNAIVLECHRESEPLLRSALAIAYRENLQVSSGEGILQDIYKKGQGSVSNYIWYKFLALVSVYIQDKNGLVVAEEALNYFTSKQNIRMAGIAANNLSVVRYKYKDYDGAIQASELSEEYLNFAGSEDNIFPVVNRAAFHLSLNNAKDAFPLLRSCLVRPIAKEYELTVMMNMALAEYGVGNHADLSKVYQLRSHNRNSWLEWLVAYNCAFIDLKTCNESEVETTIKNHYNEISVADPDRRSASLWNRLIGSVDDGKYVDEFGIAEDNISSPLQNLADLDRSIGRPVFLTFGHV